MAKNTEGGKGTSKSISPEEHDARRRAAKAKQRAGRGRGIVPLDDTYFGGRLTDIRVAREERAAARAAAREDRAAREEARAAARKAARANMCNLACGAAIRHLKAWAVSQKNWTEEDTAAAIFHLEELFELIWESDPRPRTIVDESNRGKVVKAARLRFAMTCLFNRITFGLEAHQSTWWPDAVAEAEDLCKPKARKPYIATVREPNSDTEAEATGTQDDTVRLATEPKASNTEVIEPELAAVA